MSDKQKKLVAAITAAMKAQGISQQTLGRKSGVSQSVISAAILGKCDPKEEKWRLICETLGLDYDQIVDGPQIPMSSHDGETITPSANESDARSIEREAATVTSEETRGTNVPLGEESEDLELNEDERRLLGITARYLAGNLKEDIRKGMDISLEDLHALLTICKRMQEASEA